MTEGYVELHARSGQGDLEDAGVGGVRQIQAHDLAGLGGQREFGLPGDQQDVAGLDGVQAMHLAQERTAPQALHGESAGIVAKIQRQDRLQAGVAQHLH